MKLYLAIAIMLVTGFAQASTFTVVPGQSIQAAVDFVSPGDTIEVHNGTYYESVNVTKRLILRGVDDPVVDAGSSGNAITISADGVVLDGFVVRNSSEGVLVFSDNNILKSNEIRDNMDSGIFIPEGKENTITDNIVSGNRHGIVLGGSKNKLRNNQMKGNLFNFGLADYASGDMDYDIDSSNIVDGKSIYYLRGVSDRVIDSSSNAGMVCCINCNHITVKDLNLTNMTCGIYLVNTSNSNIKRNSFNNVDYGILQMNTSNLVIQGNNFDNVDDGIIQINASNLVIQGNNINNATESGIVLGGSTNNTIIGNKIFGIGMWGIGLEESNNNIIKDNDVHYGFSGILIRGSNHNRVTDNLVYDTEYIAIHLDKSSNDTVKNNSIINNKGTGIHLSSGCSNNTIAGNNASENGDGIKLEGFEFNIKNNIIENNIIYRNHQGIYCQESIGNSVIGNDVRRNEIGILLENSNGNALYRNNLVDNSQNANDTSTNKWDDGKKGNYYSDLTCEDADGNGICDSEYEIPGGGNSVDRYPLAGWMAPAEIASKPVKWGDLAK
jgi:parallel beta-helix repeat protein